MEDKNTDPAELAEKRLLKVVALAERAGEAIMRVYRQEDFGTTYKEDCSPLTQADMAAHHLIIKGLKSLTPHLPALSEESKGISSILRRGWESYWLIDPLDGTKEFVKRNDEFTVNIALINRGVPVMGVVHAPAFDLSYYAAAGVGVYKKVGKKDPHRISVCDYHNKTLRITVSRSHPAAELASFLERIGPHELVHRGSSLKLCLVAEGAADLYPRFGRTMEWDTAAAHCVVEEAGGSVTDPAGKALRYNKMDLANPDFFVRGDPPVPLKNLL